MSIHTHTHAHTRTHTQNIVRLYSMCVMQEDGGSQVTNYIVEKQDVKTGKWEPVSKFVRNTTFEVMGLTEGHEYNFRVMAENEVGVSEPLVSAFAVEAQYPYSEFKLFLLCLCLFTVHMTGCFRVVKEVIPCLCIYIYIYTKIMCASSETFLIT